MWKETLSCHAVISGMLQKITFIHFSWVFSLMALSQLLTRKSSNKNKKKTKRKLLIKKKKVKKTEFPKEEKKE